MPKTTPQDPFGAGVSMPPLHTGQQIYNEIMGRIEQDLLTANIPTLKEKYKSETPDEAKARLDRYNKAFAEYDKQFAAENRKWNEQWAAYKRAALRSAESKHRAEESEAMQSMEQMISSF